jgi:hypothetical protein
MGTLMKATAEAAEVLHQVLTQAEDQDVTVRPTEGGRFTVTWGPSRNGLPAYSGRLGAAHRLTLAQLLDWLDMDADAAGHLAACPRCAQVADTLDCTWVPQNTQRAPEPTSADEMWLYDRRVA